MVKIFLYRAHWANFEEDDIKISVCGWGEYENKILNANELLDFVCRANITSANDLKPILQQLNGNYSIIIAFGDYTLIGADRLRSFPVVYFSYNNESYITDDIEFFLKSNTDISLTPDDDIVDQYLYSTFVIGRHTVYKDVFSIQAGELIESTSNGFVSHIYFQWAPEMGCDTCYNIENEADKQNAIFCDVITRLIKSSPNVNNWIVPLSGGHDSRMIVNYLYKSGVKNVICFSYGIENNMQSQISKKIAETLGYKWYFVEYTKKVVERIVKSGEIDKYIQYAFNGSSVVHLQDFIAILTLKNNGVLSRGDVFVPGHSLDFIAGSHLSKKLFNENSMESSLALLNFHFGFPGVMERKSTIRRVIKSLVEDYKLSPSQIPETFDWQERQSKFIVNSVRCYEYFGFDWRIPLWDNQLIEYWMRIGMNGRYGRNLFFSTEKYLLSPLLMTVPYVDSCKLEKPLKVRIAGCLPSYVKNIIRRLGYTGSLYYVPEGMHLIYSHYRQSIDEYIENGSIPSFLSGHFLYKKKAISSLAVNTVTALKIIKDLYNKSRC